MTRYAYFDSLVPTPSPVKGWYDTNIIKYTNLPSQEDLLELTDDQWEEHFKNPSEWAVSQGQLIPYIRPTPQPQPKDLAQEAMYKGLTCEFTNFPFLTATYGCASTSQQNITSVLLYTQVNNCFPGGSNTMTWYDIDNVSRVFPNVEIFIKFSKAVADYVAALTQIMLSNSGELPPSKVVVV